MRILWLAPEPPTPPLTGGRERARKMIAYLGGRHQVHLITLAEAADRPALNELAIDLEGLTVVPFQARAEDNVAALRTGLDELLSSWRPDRFHVQGLDAWPDLRRAKGCVLDLHDVPTLLEERLLALRPRRRWPFDRLLSRIDSRLRHRESRALKAAGDIIVTSRADAEALTRRGPISAPISILPNGVEPSFWHMPPAGSERPTILFPGALNWPPNVDAVQVLVEVILPLVQAQVPDVRLVIAGRSPDPTVAKVAAGNPAVTLLADPADMRPLFAQATLVTVPLRAATGTRLKILQALAARRPGISTPVGAAGLDLAPGRHLLVEPLVEPFAVTVIRLLNDGPARQRLAAAGLEVIERFDWGCFLPILDTIYPPDGDGR